MREDEAKVDRIDGDKAFYILLHGSFEEVSPLRADFSLSPRKFCGAIDIATGVRVYGLPNVYPFSKGMQFLTPFFNLTLDGLKKSIRTPAVT
jgi:hypothetical protein